MFIQNAYERRVRELEDQGEDQKKVRKNFKIGSVKNGRINYDKDEQYFAKTDMKEGVAPLVKEVQQFIDPDILELRKKVWNSSVSCPKNNEQDETFDRKLIKIRLGLIDQPVPKAKTPKIEKGTDLRDDYTNWNVSTEQFLRERRRQLEAETEKAMEMSKVTREKLLKNYTGNIQRQQNLIDELRREKIEEKMDRDLIREEYKFTHPSASLEKTDAAVFRFNYERKLAKEQKDQEEACGNFRFRPDCSQTLQNQLTYQYHHTGIYQKIQLVAQSQVDNESSQNQQRFIRAWSCCMNDEKNSQGCNKIKQDKNSWNYASIKEY